MSVRIERQGYVSTVVLSRPAARNAVDGPTAAELAAAFREFEADETARVAVLWGEGGTFCAGADLKAVGGERGNRVAQDGDGPMGPTRMTLSKPVIAAVAGHAVAGGLELALWCDLRVAEEDAVFGVFCRRWGVPLIDGGTVRLPRLIGTSRAMDMILTGRPVPAREAYEMGLANRLVPPGRARAEAEELAAAIGRFPRTACAATGPPSSTRRAWTRRRRCAVNSVTACGYWPRAWRARPASRRAPDATGRSASRGEPTAYPGQFRVRRRPDRGALRSQVSQLTCGRAGSTHALSLLPARHRGPAPPVAGAHRVPAGLPRSAAGRQWPLRADVVTDVREHAAG
ncbi:hypothetical protein SAV14893_069020 [Streptomyces avermitilis]|uniref:Enoyl-CoA hydratase n=1 Tax=Streptomyces avermitilis TaxID=33903 RepID=A0A4D4M762_STRAX|nr:hypothetical protein SAV14893_069020 [Streptomyces avermitilis]